MGLLMKVCLVNLICICLAKEIIKPVGRPQTTVAKAREPEIKVEVVEKNRDIEVYDEVEEMNEDDDHQTNVTFTSKKWNNIDELIDVLKEEMSQHLDNMSHQI
jgi:hypothetical protein